MIVMLYAIYAVVSGAILALFYRRSWPDWLLRFMIVLVFPIIGWLFPFFWPRQLYAESKQDFHDYITRQQEEHKLRHVGIYSEVETDKELNIIPIEEALLVSEHEDRRRVMIDVLKQDSAHYLEILQTAVSNEDTETSHYAVSAIMEVKRKLLIAIQDFSVQYEQKKDDPYIVKAYAEVLKGFMRSGFLDERTYMKYQHTYIELLERLIELDDEAEWAHKDKAETELALGLYALAESTGLHYVESFPDSEDAYLCLMTIYYSTRSSVKLHETLKQLKESRVRLSSHALTMVRFWSEGA